MNTIALKKQSTDYLNQCAKNSLLKVVKGSKSIQLNRTPAKQKKLRVLSIDGGGIRAILPAVLLANLEERLQQESGNPQASIVDYFDLFAGTSAGGILISLYLTPDEKNPQRPKFTAREVLELYMQDGCQSFLPANPDPSKARSEKYSATILENKLQFLLGADTTLDQLLKPCLITAYNATTETPIYFESWKREHCKVWQVARATSAAPGMFKAAAVDGLEEDHLLIDGSIFAGNPAMCAYALANHTDFSKIPNCTTSIARPTTDQLFIISVGTGKAPLVAKNDRGSWIRSMMNSLMNSGPELVDIQLQQLFSSQKTNNYYRLNPELPGEEINIDDVKAEQVGTLCQIAWKYLKGREVMMDRIVRQLRTSN